MSRRISSTRSSRSRISASTAHHGFDLIRIASAALTNVRRGRAAQGGSTITQQLARQSFLTTDKTIRRKLQELILAERIEVLYPKAADSRALPEQGLFRRRPVRRRSGVARLFRQARLGAVAVRSCAARRAGEVPDRPTRRRTNLDRAIGAPQRRAPGHARHRRIDRPDWQRARTARVVLRDSLRGGDLRGQYFQEQVRQELVDRFGWEQVYQGGLRVFSTIDMAVQDSAEAAVAQSLKTLDEKRKALASREASRQQRRRRQCRAPAGRADRHGSSHGRRARHGRRTRLRAEPLQPRGPGAPSAGVGVQAVRLRRGARGRLHAGDDDRSPERSGRRRRRATGRRKTSTRRPSR